MAIEVFNRFEKKYLMSADRCAQVRRELETYMNPDKYNADDRPYTISNIYYDTPDSALIRASLSKPKYKEKLRLRAYGVPGPEDKVFLEIKKKVQGVVNKRRTMLRLHEAYAFAETGAMPETEDYMNPQVLREIAYFLSIYPIQPRLYLAYDRRAYFGKERPDLRISFDENIRTRRTDLRLEAGSHGGLLLDEDVRLMEIKAEKSIPLWLSELLSDHGIFSAGFSKYGEEYKQFIQKERYVCWNLYLQEQPTRPSLSAAHCSH